MYTINCRYTLLFTTVKPMRSIHPKARIQWKKVYSYMDVGSTSVTLDALHVMPVITPSWVTFLVLQKFSIMARTGVPRWPVPFVNRRRSQMASSIHEPPGPFANPYKSRLAQNIEIQQEGRQRNHCVEFSVRGICQNKPSDRSRVNDTYKPLRTLLGARMHMRY